jgi:molybdenum cofactor sulfurtransferase
VQIKEKNIKSGVGNSDFYEKYPEYKDTLKLDSLRESEFKRLHNKKHVYLDYTGCSLYSEMLVAKHLEFLTNNIFGNPHSINPSSQFSTEKVDEARNFVLDYFNGSDDYICIFTSNSSGALKIIGECYPFDENSHLLLSYDNHNSVNGIREFAKKQGSTFSYIPINYEDLRINEHALYQGLSEHDNKFNKLFAFPAQSNVSGVKHPFRYIKDAKEKGWDVLLDAAAYVPTNKLDLKTTQPDFVSVSFYKIFGYPTGIGALLAKKSAFKKLKKPWFAGGTVSMASVMVDKHYLIQTHEKFEDGTINYLNIPAVKFGLEFIESVGIDTINKRVRILTDYAIKELNSLKHTNGRNLVQVFGPNTTEGRGGTIIFNIFDVNGNKIRFEYVEEQATKADISLRAGCFCNPGIDEINTCMDKNELVNYFDSREDVADYDDMYAFLGKLRGAVRISIGIVSNYNDIDYFINFCKQFKDKEYNLNSENGRKD